MGIDLRINKVMNTKSIMTDLMDYWISIYGISGKYDALPTVKVNTINKDLNVLKPNTYTVATLSCCQCLGFVNLRFFINKSNHIEYIFPINALGEDCTISFKYDPLIIEKEKIDKIIKNCDIELFQTLYNQGLFIPVESILPSIGRIKYDNFPIICDIHYKVSHNIDIIENKEEFLKILTFWEHKFGNDFGFYYTYTVEKENLKEIHLNYELNNLKSGRRRLAAVEVGRVPMSSENLCATLLYLLETRYGVTFSEPLMGYWFVTKFLNNQDTSFSPTFGPNNNAIYDENATSYVPLNKALLTLGNCDSYIQNSFKGQRNSPLASVGLCKDINLWSAYTTGSFYNYVVVLLRNKKLNNWFLDDEMFVFSIKYFWICMLDLAIIDVNQLETFIKDI